MKPSTHPAAYFLFFSPSDNLFFIALSNSECVRCHFSFPAVTQQLFDTHKLYTLRGILFFFFSAKREQRDDEKEEEEEEEGGEVEEEMHEIERLEIRIPSHPEACVSGNCSRV